MASCPDFSLGLSGVHIPGHKWSLVAPWRLGGAKPEGQGWLVCHLCPSGACRAQTGSCLYLISKMSRPQCQHVVGEEDSPSAPQTKPLKKGVWAGTQIGRLGRLIPPGHCWGSQSCSLGTVDSKVPLDQNRPF